MKRWAKLTGHLRRARVAFIGIICLAFHTSIITAQDLSYTYDDAGNLKTVKKIDLQNDPFNCGSYGNECSGGTGTCQMGVCAAPIGPPGPVMIQPPSKVPMYCGTGHCGVPEQPKIVSGRLHGHQVCGNFAGLENSFFFDCQPLPSSVDSGWQLTPLVWVNPDGTSHPNKAVVLTISTPTLTELLVDFEGVAGNLVEQDQVTRQPGDAEVKEVGAGGQVAESMTDDSHTRTWTLQFQVNTCTDVAKLDIFNVGSSGSTNGVKSNPVHVWLLRDPADLTNVSGCS